MRICVIGESICDTASVKHIIHSILGSILVESRFSKGPVTRKLEYRIQEIIEKHHDITAIIIIADLDNKNCRKTVEEIRNSIGHITDSPIIVQIAIQEIEAWYLAMPDAIESAFPKCRLFPRYEGITDNIKNPKRIIKNNFYRALGRSYRETSDGPRIAKNFQYRTNERYSNRSLERFIRKISNLT